MGDSQQELEQLRQLLVQLESQTGAGGTSCITFGLPVSSFAEGGARLREEIANAGNIRSRV